MTKGRPNGFEPAPPNTPWTGRYARLPGSRSVLHLRRRHGEWAIETERLDDDECVVKYEAIPSVGVAALIAAVNHAKRTLAGNEGGSFAINEFGSVIVPSASGDGQRMFAGRLRERLRFIDPDSGRPISLDAEASHAAGDEWHAPYVGMPYRLSGRGEIYFWQEHGDTREKLLPRRQDERLVRLIRAVRGQAGARFIVNPHGVVLTQHQRYSDNDRNWYPVFVGKISPNLWFNPE